MDDKIRVTPSTAPENSCRSAAFSRTITRPPMIRRERLRLRRLLALELAAGGGVVFNNDGRRKRAAAEAISNGEEEYPRKRTSHENDNTDTWRSHGSVSVIGRRREMEDAVAIQEGFLKSYDFFGVYDGHGGSRVAHACRDRLHHFIAKTFEEEENGGCKEDNNAKKNIIDWERVMTVSFQKMDEEVMNKGGSPAETTGSTAVVAVVGEDELIVANCGDSRAVLSRDGVAVPLSNDHKVR